MRVTFVSKDALLSSVVDVVGVVEFRTQLVAEGRQVASCVHASALLGQMARHVDARCDVDPHVERVSAEQTGRIIVSAQLVHGFQLLGVVVLARELRVQRRRHEHVVEALYGLDACVLQTHQVVVLFGRAILSWRHHIYRGWMRRKERLAFDFSAARIVGHATQTLCRVVCGEAPAPGATELSRAADDAIDQSHVFRMTRAIQCAPRLELLQLRQRTERDQGRPFGTALEWILEVVEAVLVLSVHLMDLDGRDHLAPRAGFLAKLLVDDQWVERVGHREADRFVVDRRPGEQDVAVVGRLVIALVEAAPDPLRRRRRRRRVEARGRGAGASVFGVGHEVVQLLAPKHPISRKQRRHHAGADAVYIRAYQIDHDARLFHVLHVGRPRLGWQQVLVQDGVVVVEDGLHRWVPIVHAPSQLVVKAFVKLVQQCVREGRLWRWRRRRHRVAETHVRQIPGRVLECQSEVVRLLAVASKATLAGALVARDHVDDTRLDHHGQAHLLFGVAKCHWIMEAVEGRDRRQPGRLAHFHRRVCERIKEGLAVSIGKVVVGFVGVADLLDALVVAAIGRAMQSGRFTRVADPLRARHQADGAVLQRVAAPSKHVRECVADAVAPLVDRLQRNRTDLACQELQGFAVVALLLVGVPVVVWVQPPRL